MKCPACGFAESQVLATRRLEENTAIRRRRRCVECKRDFNTYERIENRRDSERIATAIEVLASIGDRFRATDRP